MECICKCMLEKMCVSAILRMWCVSAILRMCVCGACLRKTQRERRERECVCVRECTPETGRDSLCEMGKDDKGDENLSRNSVLMFTTFVCIFFSFILPAGESCWWTIHPASKQRSEGEKVRVGDDLILVSVSSERYLVCELYILGLLYSFESVSLSFETFKVLTGFPGLSGLMSLPLMIFIIIFGYITFISVKLFHSVNNRCSVSPGK